MSTNIVKINEDILVSVCFSELSATKDGFAAVKAVAKVLSEHFRFYEIVLVCDEATSESFLPLVREFPNIRLISVRPGASRYKRRAIAAEEAIGDVVLITRAAEITLIDCIDMIEKATQEGKIILSVQPRPYVLHKLVTGPLIALGRAAGFKAGTRDMHTMALPRTLLNQVLSHPDPDLALRFPPRDPRLPIGYVNATANVERKSERQNFYDRLILIHKLLMHLAPSLLYLVTLASGLLCLLGIVFAFYVLGVWLFVSDVQPGWTTISTILSLTAAFLGAAIFGLGIGLQRLLGQLRDDMFENVAQEINKVDLFGEIASDLNVDLEWSRHEKQQKDE